MYKGRSGTFDFKQNVMLSSTGINVRSDLCQLVFVWNIIQNVKRMVELLVLLNVTSALSKPAAWQHLLPIR